MNVDSEPSLSAAKVDPDEQMIVDRIYTAVMEQRLAPRTKLSEAALCDSFGVGRMRVRQALLLLASQGIVDLHSNRGAYVAGPSPQDAKEVFEARRLIETAIVSELASGITHQAVDMLKQHVAREDAARQAGDRSNLIRLSGEFHVELARCQGNSLLQRTMRELVTRTSLIVALFGVNRDSTCPEDEHARIIAAILSGQPDQAVAAIGHHLQHIQDGLDLGRVPGTASDLASILSG